MQRAGHLELFVSEPLADHPAGGLLHDGQCVHCPQVGAGRKLVEVALQVPAAEVAEGAVRAALEEGPERFNAVGAGLSVHELADTVLHDLMGVGQVMVTAVAVGADNDMRAGIPGNEPVQGLPAWCSGSPPPGPRWSFCPSPLPQSPSRLSPCPPAASCRHACSSPCHRCRFRQTRRDR